MARRALMSNARCLTEEIDALGVGLRPRRRMDRTETCGQAKRRGRETCAECERDSPPVWYPG